MANLIDKTYFNGEINIPTGTYDGLTAAITRYEKKVLMDLLGYELYKLVAEYESDTSPQEIKDLVEGKEYNTSSGDLVKWNGLKNNDKISLIAYFVFYNWLRDRVTLTTTGGEQVQTSENSNKALATQRLATSWRLFKELYGGDGEPEYVVSAYNFLKKHEENYPTWQFKRLGSINAFDL